MPRRIPRAVTVLDTIEPLTEEEQARADEAQRRKWFDRNVGIVISLARTHEALFDELVDKCAQYEDVRLFLHRRLKKRGKRSGKRTWDKARYRQLLVDYYLACHVRSRPHLDTIYHRLGDDQGVGIDTIQKRITKARKALGVDLELT